MNSGKNALFARAFAKVLQTNLNTNYTIELNEPIIENVFMGTHTASENLTRD